MDTKELLVSASRDSQNTLFLHDPTSGNMLRSYRNGGSAAPKTVCLLDSDYVLSCDSEKPTIQTWLLNQQEPLKRHGIIIPEKATALALCPRGHLIAAAIGQRVYVWYQPNGVLLSVQRRHFQAVTCVKFSNDGNYLIVGGQDGMLVVFKVCDLVAFHSQSFNQKIQRDSEPLYIKQDHSMPIVDVHVGAFGANSRLATVSLDQTCKVYHLATGELLLSLVFSGPLSAVVFDGPCWNLYVGVNTQIQQFRLREPPRGTEDHHVSNKLLFEGHQKKVTCLDLNLESTWLVSGAEDHFIFVWDLPSRQIVKRIEHKGPITNVFFTLNHTNFFVQNYKPKTAWGTLHWDQSDGSNFVDSALKEIDGGLSDEETTVQEGNSEHLEQENASLRGINKQLYELAMKLNLEKHKFI